MTEVADLDIFQRDALPVAAQDQLVHQVPSRLSLSAAYPANVAKVQ